MNVAELIRELEKFPGDEPIYIRDLANPDSTPLNHYRTTFTGGVVLTTGGETVYTVEDLRGLAEFLHPDARVFVGTERGIYHALHVDPYDPAEERNEHWALAVECDSWL